MEMRLKSSLLVAVAATLLAGCSSHGDSGSPPAGDQAAAARVRTFEARGVIKKMDAGNHLATIKHEKIGDYMPAMTMDFNLKNVGDLKGLNPGDEVTFRLNVTEDTHWIDQLQKVTAATESQTDVVTSPAVAARWRLVRDVEPLDVGARMPDYTFTNELGRVVHLADLRGQAYAFTFIYTRCPLPDFCPRMSSNFQQVQDELLRRTGAPGNWHLFSITMDPEFDTPLVLKTYAARFKHNSERWNFLTAPLIDITAIGEQFGLEFYRPDGTIAHNLRTVVVDATGKIQNIVVGNNWKPDEVVQALLAAAVVKPDTLTEKSP
jgi:protein SCO1/2